MCTVMSMLIPCIVSRFLRTIPSSFILPFFSSLGPKILPSEHQEVSCWSIPRYWRSHCYSQEEQCWHHSSRIWVLSRESWIRQQGWESRHALRRPTRWCCRFLWRQGKIILNNLLSLLLKHSILVKITTGPFQAIRHQTKRQNHPRNRWPSPNHWRS